MAISKKQWTRQYTDDYLDLYNYALQLGDTLWQEQLLSALRSTENAVREEWRELTREQLWTQFNSINEKMLEMFALIHQSSSAEEQTSIREMIWKLKLRRIDLAKQIKALC